MSNAREYLWNKKKKEQEHEHEYEKEIAQHKRRKKRRVLLVLGAVLLVSGIAYFILGTRHYDGCKEVSKFERKDSSNTEYREFQGNLIKYSKDGISYLDSQNEELWNRTYEMSSPSFDMCQKMGVIGDIQGNKIYIFDKDGIQGELETNLPIERVRVSSQGLVAVILKDDKNSWINYYDKKGNKIAETKTSLANTGYPLDLDLSDDGNLIMVSYLEMAGSEVKTKIAFYNFGSVGKDKIDNLVSASEYSGLIAPVTEFINSDTSVAIGDNKVIIFQGKQIPEHKKTIKVKEEIQSVFYNESGIGLVVKNGDGKKRYRLLLYDLNGKKKADKLFNTDYKEIRMEGNEIYLYGNNTFQILYKNGKEKFKKNFKSPIRNVIPGSFGVNYTLIQDKASRKIRLN